MPPTRQTIRVSVYLARSLASASICNASSRVGASTNARALPGGNGLCNGNSICRVSMVMRKACGLAGAGLGLAGHVVVREAEGQHLALDRRAAFETEIADRLHDGVGQSQLRKLDGLAVVQGVFAFGCRIRLHTRFDCLAAASLTQRASTSIPDSTSSSAASVGAMRMLRSSGVVAVRERRAGRGQRNTQLAGQGDHGLRKSGASVEGDRSSRPSDPSTSRAPCRPGPVPVHAAPASNLGATISAWARIWASRRYSARKRAWRSWFTLSGPHHEDRQALVHGRRESSRIRPRS